MQYTQIPTNAFEQLQMNAGVIVDSFDPETGVIGTILGVTTGGLQIATNPTFVDYGEDMDNVPGNTWQLKRITAYDPTISGTMISMTAALTKMLSGAGELDEGHFTPGMALVEDDFAELWVVGDYSALNESDSTTGARAGFCAVKLMHALSTTGFQWQTAKEAKGQFSFEFHGHYDMEDIGTAPYELYVSGTAPIITQQPQSVTAAAGTAVQISVEAVGATSYLWQVKRPNTSSWQESTAASKNKPTLAFSADATYDGRQYRCIVTNAFGTVTSNTATLTVTA